MIATWFKNIAREREFSAFSLLRFPFFLAVLLSNFSFKYFRHSLVLNWSKFPSSEDTRPAADEWKHQFQFIFQYQWISARSMALVSMFLCNQSYASHGRDFLLGATILNFDDYATGSFCSSCSIPPTLPGRFWLDGIGCAMCSYDYGG